MKFIFVFIFIFFVFIIYLYIKLYNYFNEKISDLETKIDNFENDILKKDNKDFWLNSITNK